MQLATNPASTAIAATATNLAELAEVNPGPGSVAIGIIPNTTALAAAETVTAQIIRLDTAAVIGSTTIQNNGAGAGQGGAIVVFAPIPVGMAGGIGLQVLGSVATGNAVGSATAPVVLLAIP
jgi:hypothetical protein